MQQLSFLFPLDEHTLHAALERKIRKDVSLTITDNSTSMLSARLDKDILTLRLHRVFLHAEDPVLNELALYVRGNIKKTPLLRKFINEQSHYIVAAQRRSITLRTEGMHHDLAEIFDSLNREYFDHRVTASITWGKQTRVYRARKRTLGSYFPKLRLIRINPILDKKSVPGYFVQFIVYHEMLHADIGVPDGDCRRRLHAGEFKKREKLFRHHEKAIAWEKKKW